MLSNAILSVVLLVVILVNIRYTSYPNTGPSSAADGEYVQYLQGRIKALEAELKGLRAQFESCNAHFEAAAAKRVGCLSSSGPAVGTGLDDLSCRPASPAQGGGKGEGSRGFLDSVSWWDFISSSAVWMLLGFAAFRAAALLHESGLFSGRGESKMKSFDGQLDDGACLEPPERPSGGLLIEAREVEIVGPREPFATGSGVPLPARRKAPSEGAPAESGAKAVSAATDLAENEKEEEELPEVVPSAGLLSSSAVPLSRGNGALESAPAPARLELQTPPGLVPLDLGPPGLQLPARLPASDLMAQLRVGPPPGLPPPPQQSWDGLAAARGVGVPLSGGPAELPLATPPPSSEVDGGGASADEAADERPGGGGLDADEGAAPREQPEAANSGESEPEAEEAAAEVQQKAAEPRVAGGAAVGKAKADVGGTAAPPPAAPKLRSFASAARLARGGAEAACAGHAGAPASGEKEDLRADDIVSEARTSFGAEIASCTTYDVESEATARMDVAHMESDATATFISEQAAAADDDDDEVYELDPLEERGHMALSSVWRQVLERTSQSRGPQGEAQKRARQAKAPRKKKPVEVKPGKRGVAAGAWHWPRAWSLPCSTWVCITGVSMLAVVLVGKVQSNNSLPQAELIPPAWPFWRRKQAETDESCVRDPPKHIVMLGENEEPKEPSGIKPRIVMRANCLLKMYSKVAFRYRPTGVWYFKKDPSTRSLEVKHKHEAPLVLVTASWSQDTIKTFLQENIMPLVGPLTSVSYDWYIYDELGLIWVLFDVEGDGDIQASEQKYRPALMQVARQFKARYFTAFMDTSIVRNREWIAGEFGITEFPAVVVQDKAGVGKSSVYTGPIEVEALKTFILDAEAGCFNYEHPLLTFDGHRPPTAGMCRFPEDALH